MVILTKYNHNYWLSVLFRIATGLNSILLVKILLDNFSTKEFELYHQLFSFFIFISIVDLSYNGVRNALTKDALTNNYNRFLKIIYAAFKLNIITSFVGYILLKLLFLIFDIKGMDLIIITQIIIMNLKLIMSILQALNYNAQTAVIEYLLSFSIIAVIVLNLYSTMENAILIGNVISIIILSICWLLFFINFQRKLTSTNTFTTSISYREIFYSGTKYSVGQIVLLVIPIILMYHFKVIINRYEEYVVSIKLFTLLLTFQSIIISPYWSKINSFVNLQRKPELDQLIKKMTFITILFLLTSIALYLVNAQIILHIYEFKISKEINTYCLILILLQIIISSLAIQYNGLDKAKLFSKIILKTIIWYIPISILIYFIINFTNLFVFVTILELLIIFFLICKGP
jgi:hypothetical protein